MKALWLAFVRGFWKGCAKGALFAIGVPIALTSMGLEAAATALGKVALSINRAIDLLDE